MLNAMAEYGRGVSAERSDDSGTDDSPAPTNSPSEEGSGESEKATPPKGRGRGLLDVEDRRLIVTG